jgi:uncharacterized protein (DUF58 family)
MVLGRLGGAHRSPLSGFAVEFAGHREYTPGDDPKHIDWRVYFNRDKYFIKQYEMETNFVCHLVLDISASMRYGEGDRQKLLYAAKLATTLGYAVVRQSDQVSLATCDARVRGWVPPGNTMAQIIRMTDQLADVRPVDKTDMSGCLAELAGRRGRREIFLIFSDFFTELRPLEHALQRLRYDRHEVVLFQVLHHDELTFPLGGSVKFVGLEDSDHLLTRPDDVRKGYLSALQDFQQRLDNLCQQNGCEHVLVDTGQDLGEQLIDYLNQRSRLPAR